MLSRRAACIAARRGLITSSSSLARHGGGQRIRTLSEVSIGDAAAPQSPSIFPPTVVDLSSTESATSRFFSSKPQRKRNKSNGVIMNEQLIKVIMRRYDAPAGELHVRLVIDEGPTQPSSIEVVSLLQAMETARDLDVDLIGINLNQDPPVVKAQDYTKLAYKASNKKQTKSNKKPTKEFNFRAGIADNDLNRKVNDVVRYLKKGHNCQLSVTANGFNMRTNPGGVKLLIEKVLEQVGDSGICDNGVKSNEEGNRAFFLLRPNSKSSG